MGRRNASSPFQLDARALAGLLITGICVVSPDSAFAQRAEGERPADSARVVSLGGSVTEIIYALDADSLLVGVDRSSVWPPEARNLPNVGYYRTLNIEGVLSLEPDLVVAAEGAGPPAALEQLEAAGVRLIEIPDGQSLYGAVRRVHALAGALGLRERGERLARRMEGEIERAERLRTRANSQPRALFIWGRGGGALLAAGDGTEAAAMLEAAGAENAVTGFRDYRPLSPEAVIAAAPDVIVVPGSTVEALGSIEALLDHPGIAGTPAAAEKRVVVVDLLAFLGFGPRVGTTLEQLVRDLHPDLGTSP